jgi:hypothetical protein
MMKMTKKQTKAENLQQLLHQYREVVHDRPFTMAEAAIWAIKNNLWTLPPKSAESQLAKALGEAARVDYIADPQGRRIRRLHARRIETELPGGQTIQQTFWDDITMARPEHMQMSFQQRRGLVRSDCHQLKTDADSYNTNWNTGQQILLSYDFTEDMEEMEQSTVYPSNEQDGKEEEQERI